MNTDMLRRMAHALPFADLDHGIPETAAALRWAADRIEHLEHGSALDVESDKERENLTPKPLGRCPGCGCYQYRTEGFCGFCNAERL